MNRRDFLRSGALFGVASAGGLAGLPGAAAAQAATAAASAPVGPTLLSWNENALGLAPAARQAVQDAIGQAHRYPDAQRDALIAALASRHGVTGDHVLLGNGSTEILQMVVQAASAPNALLVLADPTFEAVLDYRRPLPYRVERVPLDAHFGHDLGRMRELTAAARRPAVVYLCNPNNPTATLTASAAVDDWIAAAPETVTFLVDEAYYEYVEAPGYWSAARWIAERPNVIVARTFSKIYAMAGLRLGYALAHPATVRRLAEFMASDNANALALAAGLASLNDPDLIPRSRASNARSKKIVHECLDDLGLAYLPSHANFLMHRLPGDPAEYARRMLAHGFRVGRPFPPLTSYNRLSLGLPAEMERFVQVLHDFRAKGWV
ncbi:MAG: aminotransferase class I/II-fold pyridoxal phosphate-dependent enzyme [Acidobacteriota bacterium]|nr:aminotransferase class I/II-fold pyridoxal phosphate-dependent enzyme [Acidobacteriota bacterium]